MMDKVKRKLKTQRLIKKKRIIQTLLSKCAFLKNRKIGLAVSGGIDSMVMMHIFSVLRNYIGFEVVVLYFDHKWRSESALDREFVKNCSKKLGIQFLSGYASNKVSKTEEKAREQRYSFFSYVAKKHKLDFICTAHHKDDQAETILFRLARGTGPKGLFPVKEMFISSHGIKYFRPLLSFSKDELKEYGKEFKITSRYDRTNSDIKYARNLIRLKVLPELEKVNNDVVNNIISCGKLVHAQNQVLNVVFGRILSHLLITKKKQKHLSQILTFPLKIDRKKFLDMSYFEQYAFIYWLLNSCSIKGSITKLEKCFESIVNIGSVDLDKNIYLKVDDKSFCLSLKLLEKTTSKKRKGVYKFNVNGSSSKVVLSDKEVLKVLPFKHLNKIKRFPKDKMRLAYVDLTAFRGKSLTVRNRRPKDVFQPLGFSKILKFKNYLINKKIPENERYNIPLICYRNEVLWLPGYSLSEKIKVKEKPTHKLLIT